MIIMLMGSLILTTGCQSMTKKATTAVVISANLEREKDFNIIDDVKGEASAFYVLGIPFGAKNKFGVLGTSSYYTSIEEMNANYDAIKSVEGADAILPTLVEKKVTLLYPLFGNSKITVKGKALEIK
ncbi:MAG: hypothetical protein B6I28_02885 [Fusobacteriia bacterium 4572_132]|nr:MAG: hypothetical protein B6I28_02885 [Fusobacteriia bacterium 4572_132]